MLQSPARDPTQRIWAVNLLSTIALGAHEIGSQSKPLSGLGEHCSNRWAQSSNSTALQSTWPRQRRNLWPIVRSIPFANGLLGLTATKHKVAESNI